MVIITQLWSICLFVNAIVSPEVQCTSTDLVDISQCGLSSKRNFIVVFIVVLSDFMFGTAIHSIVYPGASYIASLYIK